MSTMVQNYVGGEWCGVSHSETLTVTNPASGGEIGRVPLSTGTDVDKAVQAAKTAYPGWRSTPSPERARVLFRLKALLDELLDMYTDAVRRRDLGAADMIEELLIIVSDF